MRTPVIVDTNVLVVANGKASHVGIECEKACLEKLIRIRNNGRVLVDQSDFILAEYKRHLSHSGQPGLGDAFFKWLWDNQAQASICTKVDISPEDGSGTSFAVFPTDPELAGFDLSDRKFVATAIASEENPPILNATDRDWWQFREQLQNHGVSIEFLCPQHMQQD